MKQVSRGLLCVKTEFIADSLPHGLMGGGSRVGGSTRPLSEPNERCIVYCLGAKVTLTPQEAGEG
jgi:hypothetical protein